MRIVQVAPFFYPHVGGVETHVRGLATEFTRRGHEVTVVTARYDRSLPAEETREGYRIVRARTLGVLLNTPVDPAIRALARRLSADVAHLHFPPPLTAHYAVDGFRRAGIPTCLTYHCDLYLAGAGGRLLTGFYNRVYLRRTLDRVDRIIVHTSSYGRTSAMLRDRSFEVIPSVVDLTRFRPGLDASDLRRTLRLEGRRVLVFTGRLVPHKGVDLLVRSLRDLPGDVALIVIGAGPRLRQLVQLARRLGVYDRIRFCPAVTDDELPTYLSLADLFVYPSLNRLEGFGLVVAEAMAAGLPSIVSDMPGVRELIQPGREGLLVEPFLLRELTSAIRELLDDPARRRSMAAAARARAEDRFALPAVVDALLTLYQGLRAAG